MTQSAMTPATDTPPARPAKRNYDNFVVLRLIMSLLVMITHFKVLTGGDLLKWLPMSPELAVAGFFVISGYVIIASYEKLPVMRSFFAKRFFRMYPLYMMMILIQAFGMSLFFIDDLAAQTMSILRYLVTNLLMLNFLQYDIGGLLAHSHNPGINPALWTLKIEVMFYAIVPLLCWCFHRFKLVGLIVLFILSTVYAEYMVRTGHAELSRQLPGALRFIVVGMALYYYRHKLNIPVQYALPLCVVGFCFLQFRDYPLPTALFPLLAGPFIIMCATKIPCPRPKNDLSYGVYLMHSPLIQFSILTGLYRDSYWFLAALVAVACGLAYLGYRFIELPSVALGQRLSKAAAMTAPRPVLPPQEPDKV
jgi:peptidoglycan/LPS O-acetylase OafA/YrhL